MVGSAGGGRRPAGSAVAAGLAVAVVAVGGTWWYLWSTPVDDGLEALVLLPLLGGAAVLATLPAGVRDRPVGWVMTVALTATLAIGAFLVWLGVRGEAGVGAAVLLVVVVVLPFAVGGVLLGWALGAVLRSGADAVRRPHHRAAP